MTRSKGGDRAQAGGEHECPPREASSAKEEQGKVGVHRLRDRQATGSRRHQGGA